MVVAGAAAVEDTFVGLKQTVCFNLCGSSRAVGKILVQDWMRFLQGDSGVDLSNWWAVRGDEHRGGVWGGVEEGRGRCALV